MNQDGRPVVSLLVNLFALRGNEDVREHIALKVVAAARFRAQ